LILSLDTSVLVAAFTVESHSDRARSVLDREAAWGISDWAAAEFTAAIRAKSRRGEALSGSIRELDEGLDRLVRSLAADLPVLASDHRQARAMVLRRDGLHPPDALHLAIAKRIGACLVTLDQVQAEAGRQEGLEVLLP